MLSVGLSSPEHLDGLESKDPAIIFDPSPELSRAGFWVASLWPTSLD
jgi:hypothetical protein